MTIVSIRCHECDTVKPAEEIEIQAQGNICSDCKTPDVEGEEVSGSDGEPEPEVEEESVDDSGQDDEEAAEDDTEEAMDPDDFTHQEARSW